MDIWTVITSISTLVASIVIIVTALIAVYQLREMKRATVAQAFSTILSQLQASEVREARKTLIQINETDFSKWTPEQIQRAEIACNTYDCIAILLRRRVIDSKMVTAEWRTSITRCWEHAAPMVAAYRNDRGIDFWNDFEWLYGITKRNG